MQRYLLAFLYVYHLTFGVGALSFMVLQDHAWYTRDNEALEKLYDYMAAGHNENVNHMSSAGLFKANVGTKSVEVVEPLLDSCSTYNVRFKFKKSDDTWYYTRQEEISKSN